jgi:DNA-binding response OmpR family regulator
VHVNNLALGQAASPSLVRGRDQPNQERTASARGPIFVVGADAGFGRALGGQLLADGYQVKLAHTASRAAVLAAAQTPRLIVLGELDPPRGALDLLEAIRRRQPAGEQGSWPPDVPVIMLSSATEQTDLLRAFDAGADDFLTRPVQYLELRARLRAVLRRSNIRPEPTTLQIGPLKIDTASREAFFHGNQVQLRRMEYDLLLFLARDPRRTFRRSELLAAVWGYQAESTTRTVDSHASRLRGKLSAVGERWVINEWGVGYRLTAR